MADITVKKLNEFPSATLAGSLIFPLSNTEGVGYKSSLAEVRDFVSQDTGYFLCSTTAGTAAKTVTAEGFNLRTGGSMHIKFTYANTADNCTLNVGSTGALPLFLNGSRADSTNTWEANDVFELYYDGTNWQASSAGAAVEKRFQEVMVEIDSAKDDALDEIAQAIEGLNLYYDVIS